MATPGGVFVRRAEFDDTVSIQALIGEESSTFAKRYGAFEISNMIENASLGITAVDEQGQVVGYAAFYDYPALTPEADAATWPEWLHRTFGHPEYTAANTAWLAFFVADPLSANEVAESMLRTAFTTLPDVDCLLFALPPDVRPFAPLKDTFEPLRPLSQAQQRLNHVDVERLSRALRLLYHRGQALEGRLGAGSHCLGGREPESHETVELGVADS